MVTAKQRQKIRKAKVDLAMHAEFGTVPKEADIDSTFRLLRMLSNAVRSIPSLKRQQQKRGQLALF